MSGWLAVWEKTGSGSDFSMEEATAVMRHRGPDAFGSFRSGPVKLGCRQLETMALPAQAKQPLYNEDKSLVLVFDGRIYNYRQLREELCQKGHFFRSENDAEVILHLYEEKGSACVEHLRGMFAFCLYDQPQGLFFGARDRFGMKPLYYTENERFFALASEAKVFTRLPGFRVKLNVEAIPHYLTFQYVPEPETMFAGVYKIPPAHVFSWRQGKLEVQRYWRAVFFPRERPLAEVMEETKQVLREAVKLHAQTSVPLGAFLSGGIDSTVVASLLRELGPVKTFSVGYEEKGYSELSEAAATARYLGTDHEEYLIHPEEFWRKLPELIWHFDDPVADPAGISLYFAARMAKKQVSVALSGEGADEFFGGYGIYREPSALRSITWLPQPLLGAAQKLWPGFLPGKNFLRRAATPIEKRYVGNAFIFNEEEKRKLLKLKSYMPATSVTAPLYREAAAYDEVTKMQYIDLHTWVVGDILVKADKMSMANALELRSPFLDHHVFAFAATIPTRYKIKNGLTKYVLRQAFAGVVPPEAAKRPKRGFPVPTRLWLRGPLAKKVSELLHDVTPAAYFNRSYIGMLFREHLDGQVDHSRKIWTLVILNLWLQQFRPQ